MTQTHPELSQLKQEVAELWTRFRKDEPAAADDEGRRVLAELNRSLEAKRRLLADRRAALRVELDVLRRRASVLAPVVRVFGGLVGAALAALGLAPLMPDVAALSLQLGVPLGAVVLTGSLLLVGLAVARDRR